MSHFFSGGSLRIEPEIMSTIQNDYWEEFTKVNESFVHEPDIVIRKLNKTPRIYSQKNINQQHVQNNGGPEVHELSIRRPSTKVYPQLPSDKVGVDNKCFENDFVPEKYIEFRSVAVQTDGNYDDEPELPYKCCCCFRSSTPCVVWIFIGISIIFFKIGAIVTGRWIYLSSSTFDEVVFYIAFTICLGFATIYFRRGTKYHNPYDLLFLMLTTPLMWALLTFTTIFLKKDIFFYVASGIYSAFIMPYIFLGSYIAHRFWKNGKLFLRRVEGNKVLETFCRKTFFAQSLILFDTQLTICAGVISIGPSINQGTTAVWISSLVVAPISIGCAILALVIGYFAIRTENMKLTWTFTVLSINQFVLVTCTLLKRPLTKGAYYLFINTALMFSAIALLTVHVGVLIVLWHYVVPSYGKGVKGAVNRTSRNNCLQCAKLTICH